MTAMRDRRPVLSRRRLRELGLTLIEILIALISVIAAIVAPVYYQHIEKVKVRKAIADLVTLAFEIERFSDRNERLPDDFADLELPTRVDPWGHAYVYFKFGGHGWRGKARKDRFLVPINSSYDLYSIGRDGESRPPLQNPRSFDDIVRANDGLFYGLGRDF
jgi:general secretion pathway protein G